MSSSPTLTEAVAALRQFAVTMLDNRAVHSCQYWYVGQPAPTDLIAHFRAHPQLLPPELVDLYELMDGCMLDWGFFKEPMPVEAEDWEGEYGPAIGAFYLPPLRRDTRLRTDFENQFTFFGPGAVSFLFDQIRPEYGTWLVAYGPDGPGAAPDEDYEPYEPDPAAEAAAHATADLSRAGLVFLHNKTDELPLPATLAEYIGQGIAHAFLGYWPLVCWGQAGAYSATALAENMVRLQQTAGQ